MNANRSATQEDRRGDHYDDVHRQGPDAAHSQRSASPQQGSPQNLIYSGFVVAVSLALFRAGPWNLVLVLGASALLLCNPWIRTLLELPSGDASTKARSKFDPARYLLFSHDSQDENKPELSPSEPYPPKTAQSEMLVAGGKQLSMATIGPPLRKPVQHLVGLVVRDFVRYWYDPITFAHPGFPRVAEESISHMVASVYLRLGKLRNVDATSELLLTSQSVVLSALRRRRRGMQTSSSPLAAGSADNAVDSDHTWPNSSARIESLRRAVRRLLSRNMCSAEKQSPVVVSLMTEILTKQFWEAVQYTSDPDFINMQIVKWGELASETSLHDKTLSPKELEAVKKVADGVAGSAISGGAGQTARRPIDPVQATRGLFAAEDDLLSPADMGKLTSHELHESLPRSSAANAQERPAASKAPGADPLLALGGFATSAFSSVAGAAERTANVVGEGLSEVGNTLLGPVGNGEAAAERTGIPPPSMRLDMPSGLSDPPLPDSLKRSLRAEAYDDQARSAAWTDVYTIPDATAAVPISTPTAEASRSVPALPPKGPSSSPAKAPDSGRDFPSLEQVLSGQASSAYDAFESFLEEAREPVCRPGEGEAVLRLHTQLSTLSTIVQFEALDARTLQADASNILMKALHRLPSDGTNSGRGGASLRSVLAHTLERLRHEPSMATLEPLQADIYDQLQFLYRCFLKQVRPSAPQTSPQRAFAGAAQRAEEPLLSLTTPESASATAPWPLAYEPRRKNTGPTTPISGAVTQLSQPQPPSRPPSVPPRPSPAPSSRFSSAASQPLTRRQPSASAAGMTDSVGPTGFVAATASPTEAGSPNAGPVQNDTRSLPAPAEVMVTDVSNNAGKAGPLDARSLEVMIVVEGISSDGGSGDGFVLLRRWSELEALDAELQRMPRSSNPPPRLPSPKGKSSAPFCAEIEAYLQALLASSMVDHLASNPTMQRFMDKNRAGAPAEAVRERGGPAAFFGGIGKNIVSGVEAVGKTAKTGFGLQTSVAVAGGQRDAGLGAGAMPAPRAVLRPTVEGVVRGVGSSPAGGLSSAAAAAAGAEGGDTSLVDGASPFLDSVSSETSGFPSRTGSPSGHHRGSSGLSSAAGAQMSAKDLDQILSAIFAVADEAFNLQGGWTLRRGMLRVLEQVVRTTYSGSLVSTFNEAASSLDMESFAGWTEALLGLYWPDDMWSTESWPERTAQERMQTAGKAREIIVSYAPAQAGYVLGPGGRAACVEALATVHEAVTDPVTAADLGLTMTLKVLEMSSR